MRRCVLFRGDGSVRFSARDSCRVRLRDALRGWGWLLSERTVMPAGKVRVKFLLLGCGHSRAVRVAFPPEHFKAPLPLPDDFVGFYTLAMDPHAGAWDKLVTLDHNPDAKPDVLHDLESLPYPFESASFDAIHAYEVLEHTGRQGDWRFFFAQFSELWRLLRPGGYLVASTPLATSPWAFEPEKLPGPARHAEPHAHERFPARLPRGLRPRALARTARCRQRRMGAPRGETEPDSRYPLTPLRKRRDGT